MREPVVIGGATLHLGDCIEVMRTMADNSVDSIVTDPPYELTSARPTGRSEATRGAVMGGFMGMKWDASGIAHSVEMWGECLRVLKPGGHLLAFSGTRTQHRMVCAIEDAGFEIRDSIVWMYSTGFPKSHNLDHQRGKEFCGCETQPQCEVRPLHDTNVPAAQPVGKGIGKILQQSLQEQSAPATERQQLSAAEVRGGEPSLEGWRDDLQEKGQLQERALSAGAGVGATDGTQGWLPDGAQACDGGVVRVSADEDGSGASRRPQPTSQRSSEPGPVAGQQQPQAVGAWPVCGRCSLPVVPEGLGTAIKPAHEPCCMARKPLIGTVAANVLAHGTGALNIDGCRVDANGEQPKGSGARESWRELEGRSDRQEPNGGNETSPLGRWPANIIHDGSAEVVALFPDSNGSGPARALQRGKREGEGWGMADESGELRDAGTGSAARFFYCAKASRADRNEGLESSSTPAVATDATMREREDADWPARNGNHHPTVKPTDLMAYLCRLVTPPGGTVLDPFMGSGSTGKAAMREGFRFVGIDMTPEYVEIARARIAYEIASVANAAAEAKAAAEFAARQPDLFATTED